MTDTKKHTESNDKDEPSARSRGIFSLVLCLLLVVWRGPGFVDDIQLFFSNGETTVATEERRTTVARNDVYYFYFLAEGDTIRNESGMFAPLMAMTSTANEDNLNTFSVVYDRDDPEDNYPRITLRIHFFISLVILLVAGIFLWSAIENFRGKG